MVEVSASSPTSALLTSRGRDHLLCLPSQHIFVLHLSGPKQLPPKSRTVLSGERLLKMLRGSWFCSVLAQIPSLPAGCLPSAAHEGLAPSSGSGNGFFFIPSKLHLAFLCRSPAKEKGYIWREARGSTSKSLGLFLARFSKK